MSLPGPGWHQDPSDATMIRWWDGATWTEHTQASPVPAQVPTAQVVDDYVPMASYYAQAASTPVKMTRAEKDRAVRRNNGFGYAGLVLALIAFLFNPLAIPSILGIIFGAIGLARASSLDGQTPATGRGASLAAVILGLIGTGYLLWKLSQALGGAH